MIKQNMQHSNRIENLRRQLLQDNSVLQIDDFGAGSVTGNRKEQTVAAIARSAAKPKKLSPAPVPFCSVLPALQPL